jgi:hypothetical protein
MLSVSERNYYLMSCADSSSYMAIAAAASASSNSSASMYYSHSHPSTLMNHPHQMHPSSTPTSSNAYMTTEQWAATMLNGNHSMHSFNMAPLQPVNPFAMAPVGSLIHMQSGQLPPQQVEQDQMLNDNIMAAAVSYAVHQNVPSTASTWPQLTTATPNSYSPTPAQTLSPIESNGQSNATQYKWMQVKRQITKATSELICFSSHHSH